MRVLVTGGAGFIGSHIVERLLDKGHDVHVVDNLSSGKRENLPDGVEVSAVSIADPAVEEVIVGYAPDAVIHQAAQVSVRISVDDPASDAGTNVVGTVRVANAAMNAGAKAFVFASSGGAIYGEQDVFPAGEDHARRPVSPYGTSKQCGENYLDYFARASQMRVVHMRYANVYGPRQDPHGEAGVVAIFSQLMLSGKTPTINGDGLQTRDYVFVEDVARANVLAFENEAARGAINIGTGVETNVVQLAEQLAKATGWGGVAEHGEAKPGEQRRSVLDNRHAGEMLSWKPEVPIAEGLAKTAQWFAGRS